MRHTGYEMKVTRMCRMGNCKERIQKAVRCFRDDTQGIGVVEIILILVVLIALVVIFKSQLTDLVNSIFKKITSEASGI